MGFFDDVGTAFKQGFSGISSGLSNVTKPISRWGNTPVGKISRGVAGVTSFFDPTGASQIYTGIMTASDLNEKLNKELNKGGDIINDSYVPDDYKTRKHIDMFKDRFKNQIEELKKYRK